MAKSGWSASCLIFCAIVGFVNPKTRAAVKEPAATQPLVCAGLVPDDAFAAVVAYPRRLLSADAKQKTDLNQLFDDMDKRSGMSPLQMEQAAFVIGPAARPDNPARHGNFQMAVFYRLNKLHDPVEAAKKTLDTANVDEFEIGEHKCFRRAKGVPTNGDVVCFLDKYTLMIASESWLPKLFAPKTESTVLDLELTKLDPADDLTAIFISGDEAKRMIATQFPPRVVGGPGPVRVGTRSIADPMSFFRQLPELLQTAKLAIRTNPDVSLKLTLDAKDPGSAEKLSQMIKLLQQLGQQFVLPSLAVPPGASIPAEERESREYTAALAKKLVDGLVPHQVGAKVTVEIGNLGTLDSFVGKVVLASRGRARRLSGINNLKQIALAMLLSEESEHHFPAHAIFSKDGKPLLSWRVALLRQLGRPDLYNQFHLDEPWDSEHNKPLIANMLDILKSPAGKSLARGQTRYVVPVGKGTIFDGEKGIRMEDIKDGNSSTILVLEVGEDKAVTWTKPDDMDFDAQRPLAGLGTIGTYGFPAALADGSVRTLRKEIDAETFRRLILRNDGLPIDPSKL